MICPNCEESGVQVEMEAEEAITRPTNELESVKSGLVLVCPLCNHEEEVDEEAEIDNEDEEFFFHNSSNFNEADCTIAL